MGKASKEKGSGFERLVCVTLSRWVTDGKREDCFWRAAMSGGRATVRGRVGKNTNSQLGDISSVTSEGHCLTDLFVVECKFYADLNIEAFMLKRAGELYKFWQEVVKIASTAKKHPLLIAKQNKLDTLLISTPVGMELLGLYEHVWVTACAAEPCAHFSWLKSLEEVECPLGK